jgi:Sulfotransferase domain
MLPDFVIIGAHKGGTVWLSDCLREHPDVYMSFDVHEIFFFDRYFHRGVDWYAHYFRGYGGQRRVGEATSTYLADPLAPGRLRQVLPQATVIASLRNPLDRAWSEYLHLWRKGDIPASLPFSRALDAEPGILASGEYFRCLRRWRDLFPAEQLHALVLDDARHDPFGHLRRLYQILGVDPEFRAVKTTGKSNEHHTPRSLGVAKVAYVVSRSLHRRGLHPLVECLKAVGVQRLVLEGGRNTAKEPPPMSDAERERLREHYRADVAALSEWTGRDLVGLWLDGEAAR